VSELVDEEIIEVGGWDPRYARVLAKVTVDACQAIVLVDTNGAAGDQPYPYVETLFREPGGTWQSGSGSNGGGSGSGWTDGVAYAHGEADVESVTVEHEGQRHVVAVREGWWLYAASQSDSSLDNIPIRIK
jgi:hypothetical protein